MMKMEEWLHRIYSWMIAHGPAVVLAIVVLFLGLWLIRVFSGYLNRIMRKKQIDRSLKPFLQSVVVVLLRVLLLLAVMQIAGITMTLFAALVTSFGVAAGLALSGTLQNFASGVLILFLKPFRAGDNIIAQGQEGTVTEIRIFYTIVTTFDNRVVVIPNSKLSNEVIINVSASGMIRTFLYGCFYTGTFFFFISCHEKKGDDAKVPVEQVTRAAQMPDAENVGFTLPVLDALFFEEGFEADVQTQLKLTKKQVQQLKSVSGAYVATLTEEGNTFGSAREANQSALKQIRKIIGDEKTKGLLQLVARRYEGGNIAGLLLTKPNAIPTDTRIVVNAPAFRMDVYQEGKLLKTYRIGIGYPEFPLPTGMRAAENIIFNPTWTPPDEAWVKGPFQPGRKVAAGSKLNPLGFIKIPIGLPSLIHGGKAAAKLGDFASHGCVGLTNNQIQDFTVLMGQISGTPLPIDSVKVFENAKTRTRTVKLNRSIPVELRYETIVAENGNLVIYRDVYERGTNTPAEAARILAVYGVQFENLPAREKTAVKAALGEMNRDSRGKPIAAIGDAEDNPGNRTAQRAKKGKVTRTVTGKKEMSVPIAALKGKGYPVPVHLRSE